MSVIFALSVIISIICFFVTGNISAISSAFSDAAVDSVELLLSLFGIMAVWGGFMEIAEKSGITNFLAVLLSPFISKIFPTIKANKQIKSAVSMNITANFLGLGNAATPLGIEAMQRMRSASQSGDTATDAMVTFVIINTASVQLIPATTALLRGRYGSVQPMVILPAVFLASLCALAVGLAFDLILRRVSCA